MTAALGNAQQLRPTEASSTHPTVKQPDRPSIDLNSTESKWAFFKNEWELYKRRAKLPASSPEELRACCSQELRLELFNYVGPSVIDNLNESDLLKKICQLSVKGKNKAVHRQEFYSLQQEPGMPAQQFVSKLRAKAENCTFLVKCPGCSENVSYAQPMISDQLTVGLYDKDIQGEVLAKDAQLETFDAKLDLVLALEDGKRARDQLDGDSAIATQRSQYRKQQKPVHKSSPENKRDSDPVKVPDGPQGCPGCGSKAHGRGTRLPRRLHCPARNSKCENCGILGHLGTVCRKNASDKSSHNSLNTWFTSSDQQNSFTMAALQENKAAWQTQQHPLSDSKRMQERFIVPHMEWIDSLGRFARRRPIALPELSIEARVLTDTHASFHRPINKSVDLRCNIDAIADTGAQTCACGLDVIHKIGLDEADLIPTSHNINGVTATAMNIAGVFFASLSIGGSETKQAVYVGRNIQGLFLSLKALQDLGKVPPCFPAAEPSVVNVAAAAAECTCPRRANAPDKPASIPFEPTKDNIPKLERWILDYYASSAFNTCEHQPLPYMSGDPLEIHYRPDATPTAHHTPIPVPHHWKAQVKSDLDRDVRLGIIEPVPPGTPTVWCSRMVVVPKKDGSPRRTVDLQALNAATYRITHHTPAPFNQASLVPAQSYKTTLDAWNGYHSMRLNPSASAATTFITEWGRYRYLRAPQGYHVAGDGYTKAYDDFTIDFPRRTKCIDDSLLWDDTIEKCFWHTIDYISLCAKNGVVFNPTKFHFAQEELEFAGFNITWTGIKPSANILSAIKDFPKPQNITDARSWFGLVNQVAYTIHSSSAMQAFRQLLKPGKWYWDSALDTAFEESKAAILKMIEHGVQSFDPSRHTCLATDWSKTGIGFTLRQKHCRCPLADAPYCCDGGWRLIFAGSRFSTDAESRYAPIEGEALAVSYGLDKCRMFVLGCSNLLVATDHKPLVAILGDTSLDKVKNPRLFRIKEKTLPYCFTIKHVPGSRHHGPDACSRNPSSMDKSIISYICSSIRSTSDSTCIQDTLETSCISESINQSTLNAIYDKDDIDAHAITMERVRQAALADHTYVALSNIITDGFPQHEHDLPDEIRPYWKLRDHLSTFDGVCVYDGRIIIPRSLRPEVLDCLHSAHQGVAGMKARAARSVFWPGMNAAISSRRAQCQSCNRIAPSQPVEPLQLSPAPAYPFERVVADYFYMQGHQYLAYADRYTGWVSIHKCDPLHANATTLCRELRTLFGIYGAPMELSTDGGQPFASHCVQQFLQQWGVTWRVSSAYYAQSNGRAEVAVKTAKRLLMGNMQASGGLDSDRFARALLQYRNTPLPGLNASPAQLLYGRNLRDHMPSIPDLLQIRKEWITLAEDRERALAKRHLISMERYNSHAKPLPPLQVGDPVSVQNQTGNCPRRWDKTGRIAEVLDHGQYVVKMDGSGRCTLRNRKFLRRCQPFCTDTPMPAIPSAGDPVPTPIPNTADDLGADTDTNMDPIPQDVYDEHAVNIPAVQSPVCP